VKAWFRYLLPGVFAEIEHWRERAVTAESRLSDLVSQIDAVLQREREEWRAERRQLLDRHQGVNSLPLLPDADGSGRDRPPTPTNPIGRAIAEAQAKQTQFADPFTSDEFVETFVDEYLRNQAQ
jgi:hypothetical protein